MNGFELAEWITFLPGVRDGSLPLTRLSFLVPLACLALLFGIAAARNKSAPALRWGLVLLALLCSYGVFPSYPYLLTAYRDPEFRLQFLVACAALLGLGLTFFLKAGWLDVLQIILAVLGGVYGAWALLTLRPVASGLLNVTWPVGMGWFVMLAGFAALAGVGWRRLFGLRE